MVMTLESAIFDFCVAFSKCPSRGYRMVLAGTNGNGKTKCCRAVRRWVQERAIDLPLVIKSEDGQTDQAALADALMVNWAERVDRLKAGEWDIEPMLQATLLILDDVGAEHDPSKVGLEKLYLILERRERLWTIITTNTEPAFWEVKFERRIADRLFRNTKLVDLSGLPSFSAQ